MTPKKYINKLRWDNKAKLGTTLNIPDELFGKAAAKKAPAKKASAKKAASKKTAVRKAASTKTAARKGAVKKSAA